MSWDESGLSGDIFVAFDTFRRFEMKLWETDKKCVEAEAEFLLPNMRNGEGVKIMIKNKEK